MTALRSIFLILLLAAAPGAGALDIDSIRADVDSLRVKLIDHTARRSSTRWIGQLISANFDVNDPSIDYPGFPRFVVKVYNWAELTFNTYDTLYVASAPGNWKATLRSDNQVTASTLAFPHTEYKIRMNSTPYSDISASLSFLCLSISASMNINKLMGRPVTRHSFGFDFTTSRVVGSLQSTSTEGGMHITHIGETFLGIRDAIPLEDFSSHSMAGEIFYIFNHRRYSRAAAYSFSKHQLHSAGSWVAGLSFARQGISMDFSSLEDKYLETLPDRRTLYSFRYNDYTLLGGYSYNHVLSPRRWMFNVGARLSLGYKHVTDGVVNDRSNMMANDIAATAALLFNHNNFFASISSRFNGFLYYTSRFANFTSYIQFSATAGVRF